MKQLETHIKPFCHISKIPVTFFDVEGAIKWECNSKTKICSLFHSYRDGDSECRKSLTSAFRIATQLGEPYIFVCPAGLVKIATSLIINGKMQGSLVAGPVAMGNNKESVIKNLLKNISVSKNVYPELTVYFAKMKIHSPKDVANLASLFNSTVISSTVINEDYRRINEHYKEQTYIGERIQKSKKQKKQLDYPRRQEEELLSMVKNGDEEGAQAKLKSLLTEMSLLENGNLSVIKIRALGICSIMSRIFSKQNSSFRISYQEIENMEMLNKAENFKELSSVMAKIIGNMASSISSNRYSGSSSIVNQTIEYLNENYMNKISLKEVASELHTNHSYLSTLFKSEMGIGFIEYLNNIRIEQSQELLSGTNQNLVDISLRSGFESQSYFIKTFKKKNKITPSEYRKKNQSLTP